jgi:hypothetical protein
MAVYFRRNGRVIEQRNQRHPAHGIAHERRHEEA